MALDLNYHAVVVFDLDDTLYPEWEYKKSGLLYLINLVNHLYGEGACRYSLSVDALAASNDFIGNIADAYNLPEKVKESLLWLYRTHKPSIKLKPHVENVITTLEKACGAIAIITDGRSVTQRLKIESLGLSRLPLYISEEYSSEKPSPDRFIKIMSEFKRRNYFYIADNPQKDFLAPNSLGWKTIGLKGDKCNVHSQRLHEISNDFLPSVWINSLSELLIL